MRNRDCKIATFVFVQIVHAAGCWGGQAAGAASPRLILGMYLVPHVQASGGETVRAAVLSSPRSSSLFIRYHLVAIGMQVIKLIRYSFTI